MSPSHPKRVAIAVIECHDHFLVGIRGPESTFSGYHEFPGGKCNPDESSRECAIRECMEETGILIKPQQLVYQHIYLPPNGHAELDFWKSELAEPPSSTEELPKPFLPFDWVKREHVPQLHFPEANETVLKLIEQHIF